jgi:hypothetical protein
VNDEELVALVTRVIAGNSDDESVCEPEDAANDILEILHAKVDSRLKAARSAAQKEIRTQNHTRWGRAYRSVRISDFLSESSVSSPLIPVGK